MIETILRTIFLFFMGLIFLGSVGGILGLMIAFASLILNHISGTDKIEKGGILKIALILLVLLTPLVLICMITYPYTYEYFFSNIPPARRPW